MLGYTEESQETCYLGFMRFIGGTLATVGETWCDQQPRRGMSTVNGETVNVLQALSSKVQSFWVLELCTSKYFPHLWE